MPNTMLEVTASTRATATVEPRVNILTPGIVA